MRKPNPRTYAFITMYTGMGATLAGNAATANWSNPIAVAIAALPALALFVTFEMVMKAVPTASRRTRLQTIKRVVPASLIMVGSAYASVGHLLELAHANGQHGLSAWVTALLPDAMMILAAVVIHDSTTPAKRTPAKRTTPAKPRTRKVPNPITADAPSPVPARRRPAAAAPATA